VLVKFTAIKKCGYKLKIRLGRISRNAGIYCFCLIQNKQIEFKNITGRKLINLIWKTYYTKIYIDFHELLIKLDFKNSEIKEEKSI